MRRLLTLAVAALPLAGCANMHGLFTTAHATDADTLEASRTLAANAPGGAAAPWPATDWWRQFGDPQLAALIEEGLAQSPDLKIAQARIAKAGALAAQARGKLAPDISADLNVSRQRFSETYIYPPPFGGQWYTQSQLQLNLDYDFDFWGKNRAAYDSELGKFRAAEVDAFASRLMLSASIAHAYVQLQHTYDRLDIAQALLKQREDLLELTRQRVDAGLDSQVDLKQAEAMVPVSQQQIAQIGETIALTRNQLAALLGRGPDRGLAIERPHAQRPAAAALPAAVPAELIGRRPDVIAQRWRVEAAAKDIDVAKAQFYPDVNLVAFIGFQSLGLSDLLQYGSRALGVGPAVSLPIYAGGQLRANLAGKNADYDIAVEQYNQTLVDALHDVVDQLASLRSAGTQRAELDRGIATAREAYDLAQSRYRAGIDNYLQVLAAQGALLAQMDLDADLHARELDLAIDLIRALGGGFDNPAVAAAPPS